jgi:putative peptide zinc metalloprotease protein
MWHFIAPPRLDQVFWPGFVLALFLHLSFHEFAHAVACQQYKVPIREVGVGLLYYLFPFAYVDRSDSHRVQQRIPRVAIAVAGPAADLIGAGVSAAVALTTAGTFRDTAVLLCMAQVANLVANLNPLMPSDGYHALETVLGELNLRKRASSYLLHRLTGKVLPSSLAYVGPKERTFFLLYSSLVSVYTLLVLGIGGLALARYVVF